MGILDRLLSIKPIDNLGEWKNQLSDKESLKDNPIAIFFGGMSMEAHSNVPVMEAMFKLLAEKYGKGPELLAFASMLSSEAGRPNRFEDMAKQLSAALESGRPTYIFMYSLGAAEFLKALLLAHKNNPDLKTLKLDNLKLIVRSPAGAVENIRDSARQMRQFMDLMWTNVGSKRFAQLEHLLTFPPKDQEGKSGLPKAMDALREAWPDLFPQNDIKEEDTIPVSPTEGRDFRAEPAFQFKRPVHERELARLDRKLIALSETKPLDKAALQDVLEQRTGLLQREGVLSRLLGNKDFALTGRSWEQPKRFAPLALLGFFPLARRAFFGYDNQKILNNLQKMGASVDYIVPECEVFTTLTEIENIVGKNEDETEKPSIILTPDSHITLTNRTTELAGALSRIINRPKAKTA